MPIHGAALLATIDSMAAIGAVIAVVIGANLPNLPATVEGFLSARVSVKNVLLLVVLATSWPAILHLWGLYQARRLQRLRSELGRVVGATTLGTALVYAFPLTAVSDTLTLGHLPHFWLVATAFALVVRGGRRAMVQARRREACRVLIVGTGRLAQRVYADIRHDGSTHYEVVGFVDEPLNGMPHHKGLEGHSVATLQQLEEILMRQVIDQVIIALPVKSCYQQIQDVIAVCERAGVAAKYGADLFESRVVSIGYDAHGDRPFVAMHVTPQGYQLGLKRAVDLVGALVGLVVLAPVMLLVAVGIKVTSPGPILFAQNRCGMNKRPLRMYKFRTMCVDAERLQPTLESLNEARGPVFKIRNDPRVTPFGRFLRKSSLDELPQLWNVLRGDMSLVGPRPLPWRDVARITRPSDMRRFSMRPGITCLWQVQGRNNLPFERWVELDLEYIDRWSPQLDLLILARTVPAVLSGTGAA